MMLSEILTTLYVVLFCAVLCSWPVCCGLQAQMYLDMW